jgi:hypothetical protein
MPISLCSYVVTFVPSSCNGLIGVLFLPIREYNTVSRQVICDIKAKCTNRLQWPVLKSATDLFKKRMKLLQRQRILYHFPVAIFSPFYTPTQKKSSVLQPSKESPLFVTPNTVLKTAVCHTFLPYWLSIHRREETSFTNNSVLITFTNEQLLRTHSQHMRFGEILFITTALRVHF